MLVAGIDQLGMFMSFFSQVLLVLFVQQEGEQMPEGIQPHRRSHGSGGLQ